MKKVSDKQREKYRYLLEDKGVPEVIAYMASLNLGNPDGITKNTPAYLLIGGGFFWHVTPEGFDFWSAVKDEVLA